MSIGYLAARHLRAGQGALAGAGLGAAYGAAKTPEEGGSRARGAAAHAIVGAAAGGAGGALGRSLMKTHILNPRAGVGGVLAGTAKRWGKNTSNFARRQLYGFTGIGDPKRIGMPGNARAEREVKFLTKQRDYMLKRAPKGDHAGIRKSYTGDVKGLRAEGREDQALQDAGVTSLPGMGRALLDKKKRGKALKAMGRAMTSSPMAMGMAALPVAMDAPEIMKGDESATGGPTLGHKLRRTLVESATGAASAGLPIAPAIAAGAGTDAILRRINPGRGTRKDDE